MIERKYNLLNKCIFVDGQPGCGKTLFNFILSTFEKVEIFNYSSEIENICALYFLKKIKEDAAISSIKIHLDLMIYEIMMSRRLNFRPKDLTSIFNHHNPKKYFDRLVKKGDELIPNKIKREKPILHIASHNLLPFSEPILKIIKQNIFSSCSQTSSLHVDTANYESSELDEK